jgi:hypothetical protein
VIDKVCSRDMFGELAVEIVEKLGDDSLERDLLKEIVRGKQMDELCLGIVDN